MFERLHAYGRYTLRADCQNKFESCGIPDFVHIPEGKTLADQVAAFRLQEDKRFPEPRDEKRPAFHDPTIHSKGYKDTREGMEGTGEDLVELPKHELTSTYFYLIQRTRGLTPV
ncbi:hypothetical protein AAF712_013671 [Marasmius tenuissimus]|uniref:Uncharacterized protein n=1 Tax=Marasmius tenuissimus TaxID=585030 RepID=A0ABR2ZD32_9AGAR